MAINLNQTIVAVFAALTTACTTAPPSPKNDQDMHDAANAFVNSVSKDAGPGCRYIPDPKDPEGTKIINCMPQREFPK